MSNFKNDGVQVAEFEYDYAVDGGATGTFTLSSKANAPAIPLEAIVEEVVVRVVTAAASDGAASGAIGYTGSTAAYVANAAYADYSEDAILTSALSSKLVVADANKQAVLFTLTGAALTAGKFKVLVKYLHHTA